MEEKGNLIFPQKLIQEKETDNYGKFIAEPFEPGFGHTVGNSLRRILLSCIKGSAITSVRIKGVLHEFDIIKNVKEDVMHILLNIKNIRLKMYTTTAEKIFVSIKGEKTITAGDLNTNPNVEILNPEQYIATVEPGGIFEAEFEVEHGKGYVFAEDNKKQNYPTNTLFVDSLFSPIVKVNYEVENTRVGYRTDYDRLIMEIWTDKSILPSDALAYASKILRDSVKIFMRGEEKETETEEKVVSQIDILKKEKLDELLKQSIDLLGLSSRPYNCLVSAKITTIGELVKRTENELLTINSLGGKSLTEIKEKLAQHDLKLRLE